MTFKLPSIFFPIFAFLSLISPLTSAFPSTLDPTKATIAPMTFNGSIHNIQVQLNGTAQEIIHQFSALHPNIDISGITTTTTTSLTTRAETTLSQHFCCPVAGWGWKPAPVIAINEGIQYLNGLNGCCGVPARSCVRVSCSWESAIWVCNDNDHGICPNCAQFSDAARDIVQLCESSNDGMRIVCGQGFVDDGGWNAIVRQDRDNC